MKNLIITTLTAVLFLIFAGFKNVPSEKKDSQNNTQAEETLFIVSDTVQVILEKSCLPCHGIDGSKKAKMKWNFEKMPDMKVSKQVSKLNKIASVVKDEKMPTSKFIKKYPDRNLTNEERKLLITWAEEQAEKLVP